MRTIGGAALAALGLWIGLPFAADATRLDVLAGSSGSIGGLTFHWTAVSQTGGLDLSKIDLVLVSDSLGVGFDVLPDAGALAAANLGLADLLLKFTVDAPLGVDAAGNHLTAVATGSGSSASVSELIDEAPAVDLGVFVAPSVSLPDNEQALGATFTGLSVTKNLVVAAGADGSAEITKLEQRFAPVPEPGTVLLVALGLAGIAARRRDRT